MDAPTIDNPSVGDVFRLNPPINVNGLPWNLVMVVNAAGDNTFVRRFDPNDPSRDLGFLFTRPKSMLNLTPANTVFVDNYPYSNYTDRTGKYVFPEYSKGLRDDPSVHMRGGRTKRTKRRRGGRSIRKRGRSNKKRSLRKH